MTSIYLITFVVISIISPNYANIDEKRKQFNDVLNALNFTGKVALITGSGTGIGAETARLFSYLGGQVVITNIDQGSVRAVAEECQQLSPYKHKPLEVVADLANGHDIKRLADQTIIHFGKIDILVNCAGMTTDAPIADENYLEAFDKVFKVNLKAPLQLTNLLAPFLKQTNGTIINIASIAAKYPIPGQTPYIAAKSALVQVSRTLAVELGPNVRVNSICPGQVPGGRITGVLTLEASNLLKSKTAMGRTGYHLDVSKAILFLASPLAQWMSGQDLDINGGFYGDLISASFRNK